jgi:hypothetical protein
MLEYWKIGMMADNNSHPSFHYSIIPLLELKVGYSKLKPKLSDFQVCRIYKEDVVSL